jgi:hypothetical protein
MHAIKAWLLYAAFLTAVALIGFGHLTDHPFDLDDGLYLVDSAKSSAAEVDEVLITMDVSGTTLSQLVMAFQPAGLVFDPWAHINLSVGRDLIDLPLTDLVAWHIYDDGTAEQVPFSIVDNNPYHIQIFIKVPGFSRYGMGGGT